MLMNNKCKTQTRTGNPTRNWCCLVLASQALNMSCDFGQSPCLIESSCMVNIETDPSSQITQNRSVYCPPLFHYWPKKHLHPYVLETLARSHFWYWGDFTNTIWPISRESTSRFSSSTPEQNCCRLSSTLSNLARLSSAKYQYINSTVREICTQISVHRLLLQIMYFRSNANHIKAIQDRRWNADKPSAALDPYIPTWLTISPANHRPANFWFDFFFFFTFKGNCEKWCNLMSNWWASTSDLKFPFSDSFKYK